MTEHHVLDMDWADFWDQKARSVTDFQATGRGGMDVVGFLYTVREVVRILELEPTHTLLDVGCGTGLIVLAISPWVRRIHGIDLSENMISRAASNLSSVDNASVSVGSICELDQAPGEWDRLLAYSVLQYLDGEAAVRAAFERIHSMLGPGGRALLAANPDPARRPLLENSIRERMEPGAAESELETVARTLWISPQRLVEMAREVGFEARAEPIDERIWQHFYMFDLVLEKHG